MTLITCGALVSFHGRLEDQVVKFYKDMASNKLYAAGKETFLSFAKESEKYKERVSRAYYGVITDGLEACYIKSLDEEKYAIKTKLTADMSYSDALKMAIEVEEKTNKFCVDAYVSSKDFMADVSQALMGIADRIAERKHKLQSLFK